MRTKSKATRRSAVFTKSGKSIMFPFQPLDLSKLSYAAVLDLIAPVLPGGTIALGWLYGHEAVWSTLHDEKALKIVIATFAVYVVGFAVLNLSALELVAIAFAALWRKTEFSEPWKNSEWRKLAARFLGPELSPPTDEAPPQASEISTPSKNAKNLFKALAVGHTQRLAQINFTVGWQKWYEILRVSFPTTKDAQQTFVNFYFSLLNSIGWAGLISAYISHKHVNWLHWLGCVLLLIASHLLFIGNLWQQLHPDPSGDQLAAEILKAIKNRDRR